MMSFDVSVTQTSGLCNGIVHPLGSLRMNDEIFWDVIHSRLLAERCSGLKEKNKPVADKGKRGGGKSFGGKKETKLL